MLSKYTDEIFNLLNKYKFSKTDIELVQKSIDFAIRYHAGQKRKSGELFITHPFAVAKILIEWGLDIQTICAGILHDIVEDTVITIEEIQENFGDEITNLVRAVTKVSTYSSKNRADDKYGKNKDTDNYIIKVFMGMSKDLRVILVKLADRTHNMSTIRFLKPEKQKRIALETRDIYAPIASRLGMSTVKTDLSDMCMQILEPTEYKKMKLFIDNKTKMFNDIFDEAINRLKICLNNNHITYDLKWRIKSVFSTYEKYGTSKDILDLFAVRILVDQPLDCYLCLGVVHNNFLNIPSTFKDFISTPKPNLYQSLHTGIIYKGLNIEVQIRTNEMDKNANFGIAAHWKYKENVGKDFYIDSMMTLINENVNSNNLEALEIIKEITKQKFINVLNHDDMTWKVIPEGISILDYAYIIDKNRLIYLKEVFINDVKANMYQIIQTGDIIKVFYSTTKTIKPGWEYFTNDNQLKKFIHQEIMNISSNLENSVDEFVSTMSKQLGSYCNRQYILDFINKYFNFNSIKDFLDAMKYIKISYKELNKLFGHNWKEKKEMIHHIRSLSWKWQIAKSLFVLNTNVYFSKIIITKCCSKIPPLEVVGVLDGEELQVHKFDCPRINKKDKIIVLKWDKEKIKKSTRAFRAKMTLEGPFTADCSQAIVSALTRYKTIISTFVMHKDKQNSRFTLDLVLYVKNFSNIAKLAGELQNKGLIYSWKLI